MSAARGLGCLGPVMFEVTIGVLSFADITLKPSIAMLR